MPPDPWNRWDEESPSEEEPTEASNERSNVRTNQEAVGRCPARYTKGGCRVSIGEQLVWNGKALVMPTNDPLDEFERMLPPGTKVRGRCTLCNGIGFSGSFVRCPACDGTGWVARPKPLSLVPACVSIGLMAIGILIARTSWPLIGGLFFIAGFLLIGAFFRRAP